MLFFFAFDLLKKYLPFKKKSRIGKEFYLIFSSVELEPLDAVMNDEEYSITLGGECVLCSVHVQRDKLLA